MIDLIAVDDCTAKLRNHVEQGRLSAARTAGYSYDKVPFSGVYPLKSGGFFQSVMDGQRLAAALGTPGKDRANGGIIQLPQSGKKTCHQSVRITLPAVGQWRKGRKGCQGQQALMGQDLFPKREEVFCAKFQLV